MKLKVGDKVRVKESLKNNMRYGTNTFVSDMSKYKGQVVTITKCMSFGEYRIEEDDERWNWTKEMFEPVPSFGKHLLRDGVIVKRRDGSYAIVMGDNIYSKKGNMNLCSYNETLEDSCFPKIADLDIMAIYRPVGYGSITEILDGKCLELIAERPEVKEMTLEEICKELGYDVKIVKEE